MRILINTFAVLFLFTYCKPSKQDMSQDKGAVGVTVAQKELGDVSEEIYNSDKSKLLAVSVALNKVPSEPRKTKKYIVVDVASSEIVYRGIIEGGYVKWLDEKNIEAFSTPGMVRQDQNKDDLITVVNIITGEKTTKTLYKAKIK